MLPPAGHDGREPERAQGGAPQRKLLGGGRSNADLNRSKEGLCATEEGLVGVMDDEVLLTVVGWCYKMRL